MGRDLFEWADIDAAPRSHVDKHVQHDRRPIVSECYALQMEVDHHDAVHPKDDPIQLVPNVTHDVEEETIARGLDQAGQPPLFRRPTQRRARCRSAAQKSGSRRGQGRPARRLAAAPQPWRALRSPPPSPGPR